MMRELRATGVAKDGSFIVEERQTAEAPQDAADRYLKHRDELRATIVEVGPLLPLGARIFLLKAYNNAHPGHKIPMEHELAEAAAR